MAPHGNIVEMSKDINGVDLYATKLCPVAYFHYIIAGAVTSIIVLICVMTVKLIWKKLAREFKSTSKSQSENNCTFIAVQETAEYDVESGSAQKIESHTAQ